MTRTEARKALSPASRVGVIAGEGRLPLDVAEQAEAAGYRPFVVLVGREEATEAGLRRFEHETVLLEDGARALPLLKSKGVTHVVLAGAIARRPKLVQLRPSLALFRLGVSLLRGLTSGDDRLLTILVRHIEKEGIAVVGAHEIAADLVAEAGVLTKAAPNAQDKRDLDAAWAAAGAIGALDIGQAAIAIGGRVVALEGVEGTDGLLSRTRGLREHGRLAGATRGVLVKRAKPQQELRVDMPTIGPQTVIDAAAAELAGIGIHAGRSLLVERQRLLAEADRLGLFVVGL